MGLNPFEGQNGEVVVLVDRAEIVIANPDAAMRDLARRNTQKSAEVAAGARRRFDGDPFLRATCGCHFGADPGGDVYAAARERFVLTNIRLFRQGLTGGPSPTGSEPART